MPMFPIIELFDRLAIAQVKWERTKGNKEELDWYSNQVTDSDLDQVKDLFDQLKVIHNQIWELEWQLKIGVEDQLPMDEIGHRAIEIRDYNNKRIAIKNTIAEIFNDNVREIKKDHLSE
jgi:hypothetical protein